LTTALEGGEGSASRSGRYKKWKGIIIDFKQGRSSVRPQGSF